MVPTSLREPGPRWFAGYGGAWVGLDRSSLPVHSGCGDRPDCEPHRVVTKVRWRPLGASRSPAVGTEHNHLRPETPCSVCWQGSAFRADRPLKRGLDWFISVAVVIPGDHRRRPARADRDPLSPRRLGPGRSPVLWRARPQTAAMLSWPEMNGRRCRHTVGDSSRGPGRAGPGLTGQRRSPLIWSGPAGPGSSGPWGTVAGISIKNERAAAGPLVGGRRTFGPLTPRV